MDSHQSLLDDASFVVLGLGSMPPSSLAPNMLSDEGTLDSITSYESNTNTIQQKLELLIRENNQLRDALNQNNLAMKTQFEALSKWQQEVSETHRSHKQKFEETRALVIKLKSENLALRNSTGSAFDERVQSQVFSLQRQNDQLKAEKLVLVKERDSFREECTKLNLKISDLELAVSGKTEELDDLRKKLQTGKNIPESMQSWMIPRHPLSIEVDCPPVPDVHSITVEMERLKKLTESLQDLQKKFDDQGEEMKKKQEEHNAEIEEKNKELNKLNSEIVGKDAFLKTAITDLLHEKEKNQQLTAECEKLTLLEPQLEVYKNDYKEERAAREKLADEKENLAAELRRLQAKVTELESRIKADVCSSIPEEGMSTVEEAQTDNPEPQLGVLTCPMCYLTFGEEEECQRHANECLDKLMLP